MKNPNFLILDEPTNDFDLMTLEVLETFLKKFKGCLIIISHDRYFMDSLVDHTFLFRGNGEIKDFPGNYSDYRKSIENEPLKTKQSTQQPTQQGPTPKDDDSQKLADTLYREIQTLERTRDKLKTKLFQEGIDFVELGKIAKEIENLELEIETKNEKWLELSL